MKKRSLIFGFLILSVLLALTACKPRAAFHKHELAGHWISKDKVDQFVLDNNGKASGKFINHSLNDCIWSVGNTLAGAENTKNSYGEYLAITCKKENRIYSFHIDALRNNQLTLNYVIWGKQFVFERRDGGNIVSNFQAKQETRER